MGSVTSSNSRPLLPGGQCSVATGGDDRSSAGMGCGAGRLLFTVETRRCRCAIRCRPRRLALTASQLDCGAGPDGDRVGRENRTAKAVPWLKRYMQRAWSAIVVFNPTARDRPLPISPDGCGCVDKRLGHGCTGSGGVESFARAAVSSKAFSPDGRRLAAGADGRHYHVSGTALPSTRRIPDIQSPRSPGEGSHIGETRSEE